MYLSIVNISRKAICGTFPATFWVSISGLLECVSCGSEAKVMANIRGDANLVPVQPN